MAADKEITNLLGEVRGGNAQAADRLMELVYPELRRLAQHYMNRERPGHTLQATALVHEAYLRLFGAETMEWQSRAHFFAVASRQMRRILVDHARGVEAQKRGGEGVKISLEDAEGEIGRRDEDVIALDQALERLEALDARAARVVELRFFGGLTEREAAEVVGVSLVTVKRDWEFARAWLFEQLGSQNQRQA